MFGLIYRIATFFMISFLLLGVYLNTLDTIRSIEIGSNLSDEIYIFLLLSALITIHFWFLLISYKMEKKKVRNANLIDSAKGDIVYGTNPNSAVFYILVTLNFIAGMIYSLTFFLFLRNLLLTEYIDFQKVVQFSTNFLIIFYGLLSIVYCIRMIRQYRINKRIANQ